MLTDDVKEFLDRQWEEKDWKMQYQQLYTLLDYAIEQAYEQGIPDPTTTVKEEFMTLDPTLTYDEAKEEFFERLGLSLPSEARDIVQEVEQELSEVEAQRDALEELVEETPKAKRIRELGSELESREATIERLESRIEGLRKEMRGKREVPTDLRKDIDRVEETVLDFSDKLDRMETELADVLGEIVQRIEKAREVEEVEVETLPEPPEVLKNIVERYPVMKETPAFLPKYGTIPMDDYKNFKTFINYLKTRKIEGPVDISWEEFIQFLDTRQGVDLAELREYNQRAVEEKEPADTIFGHFQGYILWRQRGREVPEPKELTEKEAELRDFVFNVVEEQRPDLKAKAIWRTVRDKIEEEKSFEENKEMLMKELRKTEGIRFPGLQKKEKIKEEEIEEFVKEVVRKQTQADPEEVWGGIKVFFDRTKSFEENLAKMKDILEKQDRLDITF